MLYHFSEDAKIQSFVPRKVREDLPAVVWAIDEAHAVNYFFPRDCPRVIYSKSANVSAADEEAFFGHSAASTIIAVESDWYDRIKNTRMYRYYLAEDGFSLLDETAGYYISTHSVEPVTVEPVYPLIDQIVARNVELRITPSLHPIRDALLQSTIDNFSIIRFRNAGPSL